MDAVVTKLEKEKVSLTDQIDKMSDQLAEVSNLKALEERELENKETLQVFLGLWRHNHEIRRIFTDTKKSFPSWEVPRLKKLQKLKL